jgi:hypothetical protein
MPKRRGGPKTISKPPRHVRRAMEDLEARGLRPTVTLGGNQHLHIRVTHEGNTRTFIASNTPSDYRSEKNLLADVQRFLRSIAGSGRD